MRIVSQKRDLSVDFGRGGLLGVGPGHALVEHPGIMHALSGLGLLGQIGGKIRLVGRHQPPLLAAGEGHDGLKERPGISA